MRAVFIALSALVASAAVPVAGWLWIAPDGHLLQVAPALLVDGLPFTDFRVPGLILGVVVGGGALLVLIAQLVRARAAATFTAVYGVALIGWIVVQLALIREVAALHVATLAIGVTLASAGDPRWLAWVAANAVGELLGLGGVALGVWALVSSGAGDGVVVVAAVALGAFEGLVVGAAQAQILRSWLPALARGVWVRATVLGAVVAWALGSLPSLFVGAEGGAAEPGEALQMLLAAGLGFVAGPILAAFQLRELRRHLRGAGWWLLANGVAWAVGMPLIFVAAGVAAAGNGVARYAALLLAAGGLVGAVHGLALKVLIRRGSCSLTGGVIDGPEQRAGRREALAGR